MLGYGSSPPPTVHIIAIYALFVGPVLLCPIVASICARSTTRLGWKYVPLGIGVGVATAATNLRCWHLPPGQRPRGHYAHRAHSHLGGHTGGGPASDWVPLSVRDLGGSKDARVTDNLPTITFPRLDVPVDGELRDHRRQLCDAGSVPARGCVPGHPCPDTHARSATLDGPRLTITGATGRVPVLDRRRQPGRRLTDGGDDVAGGVQQRDCDDDDQCPHDAAMVWERTGRCPALRVPLSAKGIGGALSQDGSGRKRPISGWLATTAVQNPAI